METKKDNDYGNQVQDNRRVKMHNTSQIMNDVETAKDATAKLADDDMQSKPN